MALFGLSGIVLLIIGYYLWEMITPYNLRREIHENKNLAVAIVAGAFVIGMAHRHRRRDRRCPLDRPRGGSRVAVAGPMTPRGH